MEPSIVTRDCNIIFKKNGLLSIENLTESLGISHRHLELEFQKEVGLTPKLFARIVKFNYIFQVMKNDDRS